MTDTYDPPRVLGCTELAEWFELRPRTVHVMHGRGVLPEPDQVIGGRTPIWYRDTLRRWGEHTGRLRDGQVVRLRGGRPWPKRDA